MSVFNWKNWEQFIFDGSFFNKLLIYRYKFLLQFKLSSAMIGLLFLLLAATYAISSPFWGWLAEKAEDTDVLMVVGLIISGGALLFLGPAPFIASENQPGYWKKMVTFCVLAINRNTNWPFFGCIVNQSWLICCSLWLNIVCLAVLGMFFVPIFRGIFANRRLVFSSHLFLHICVFTSAVYRRVGHQLSPHPYIWKPHFNCRVSTATHSGGSNSIRL